MKREECHHGSLRRSCDRCDMEQDIEALQRDLAVANARLAKLQNYEHRIRAAEARAEALQAEVDRLTQEYDPPLGGFTGR